MYFRAWQYIVRRQFGPYQLSLTSYVNVPLFVPVHPVSVAVSVTPCRTIAGKAAPIPYCRASFARQPPFGRCSMLVDWPVKTSVTNVRGGPTRELRLLPGVNRLSSLKRFAPEKLLDRWRT